MDRPANSIAEPSAPVMPMEMFLPSCAVNVKPFPLFDAVTPVVPVFLLIKVTTFARVEVVVKFAVMVWPFKLMEATAEGVKAFPIKTLGFAVALTLVDALDALMAAAKEMALDEALLLLAVSEVETGAPIAVPLITRSLAVNVNGAELEPARFEVEY